MNYPLIKKWLALEVGSRMTLAGKIASDHISADALEAKLAEGFEVYLNDWGSMVSKDNSHVDHKRIALAIGLQPIKKQTKEEAALEFIERVLKELEKSGLKASKDYRDAKEILEMKK